jgi:prepilin signal peptidase PulO-like enzyme (type II secretory pathway)
MNAILALPAEVRLAVLAVLGVVLGALVNLGAYRLAWCQRSISPWWPADPQAPPRRLSDRLPIVGWFGLRRESPLHGRGFWIRPLIVELVLAAGVPTLYWWEVLGRRLLPVPMLVFADPWMMHAQYFAHVTLLTLLLLASLIDIDEKTIPDGVTLPGAILGILVAAAWPWSLLPAGVAWGPQGPFTEPLTLSSPLNWPPALEGFPQPWSLVLGLACWWAWCAALAPRTWYTRHGLCRAVRLSLARTAREPATLAMAGLGLVGSAAIAGVWWLGDVHWVGMLTALVGLAAGGGIVWVVRVVGSAVLRREAMGFGDVTLMAMIGTFLGWQSCLLIFFLAPLAGLVVGVAVLVSRRETEIPYGPFLCLATLGLLVGWPGLWQWAQPIYRLGPMLPLVLAGCVVILAAMLGLIQLLKRLFGLG